MPMPMRSSSWMDEVGASAPRRPSVSGPLLPYTLGSTPVGTNLRSYSFSAGETQIPRNLGYYNPNAAYSAIAEEAITDEAESINSSGYVPASRRSSTPLIGRNPWGPLQGNQQQGFFDTEFQHSRPLSNRSNGTIPLSPTGISRIRELPATYEHHVGDPTTRDIISKVDANNWPSHTSFSQLGPFQDTPYAPNRIRPTSRTGLTRAETWDCRIGDRVPREWEIPVFDKTYYAVIGFKSHRADVYYFNERDGIDITVGSYVIVDADRGHDLGKTMFITELSSEALEIKRGLNRENYNTLLKASRMGRPPGWNNEQSFNSYHEFNTSCSFTGGFHSAEGQSSVTKAVKRLALDHEIQQLEYKTEREETAKRLCILAVQRHGLHLHEMEILEAEFQYDWGKLTFYFLSPQYLHFNPLVTELFKLFKTRIWMSALNPASCVAPSPQQMMRGPPGWSEHAVKSVHTYDPSTPQLLGRRVNNADHSSSTVSSLDLQV